MKVKKKKQVFLTLMVGVILIGTWKIRAQAKQVGFSEMKITMYTGTKTTLKLKKRLGKMKWSTTNRKVASVNKKGKVVAKREGKAVVKAKTLEGKIYKFKVIVKNPYINVQNKELMVGEQFTLVLTGTEAKSWISSDSTVVTVDNNGVLSALKAGTAIITCNASNQKKYTCQIVVIQKEAQMEKEMLTNETEQSIVLEENKQPIVSGETEQPIEQDETKQPAENDVSNGYDTTSGRVSPQQFREYYQIAEEVPDSFLRGYIKLNKLDLSALSKKDWGESAKRAFANGLPYGHSIAILTSGEERFLKEDENLQNVTHVIIEMDKFIGWEEFCEPRTLVLDCEEKMLYFSEVNVRDDYTESEYKVLVSQDEIDEILVRLQESITPKWEVWNGLEEKAQYIWRLNILLPGDDVIHYKGEGVDEENRPGFDAWYQWLHDEFIKDN